MRNGHDQGVYAANMAHASFAVHYVREKHGVLAGDRPADQLWSLTRFSIASICVDNLRADKKHNTGGPEWVKENADMARERKCGNCGEMASLAFDCLQERKVSPIDILGIRNADHAFVVIARDAKSDLKDATTWGRNAVVCDAWEKKWYPARDIKTRMSAWGSSNGFFLVMRWEG